MRLSLLNGAVCLLAVLSASPANAAPVSFSGTVTYAGHYAADSLYVALVDTAGPTTIGYHVFSAGTPPLAIPFSIQFDNAGLTAPVLLAALLDVDHSGFNPDSLDTAITHGDVLGWYAANPDPAMLDASLSRSGLDFPLPTAEIHGDLIFALGQPWAEIKAFSVPNHWSPPTLKYVAAGPYSIIGLYAGSWGLFGGGPYESICYGDPTCANPAVLHLVDAEVRTGIDLDFTITAVAPSSWGGIKQLYR